VSGQQHAPAALYPREIPGTHFTGGWVGPRAGLDGRKISSPLGFDPGPSLYRLSHPAYNSLKWSVLFRTTHPKPASIPFFPIHATRSAHLIAPINSLSAMFSNTLIPSSAPCPLNITATHTEHVQENCYPRTACSHRYMLVQKYPVIRCGNCGDKWKVNGTIRRPNLR